MSIINRLASPIHVLDENLNDTEAVRLQKIESIKLRNLAKTPYSIGAVSDIEKKVSKLEEQIKKIQSVVDCKLSDSEEDDSDSNEGTLVTKSYSLKAVSFNKPERIKKIVKKSLSLPRVSVKRTEEKNLPKLIELCQYPGFYLDKESELPGNVSVQFILQRVHVAQNVNYMKVYKEFFDKWFYSFHIQKLLKDMFWFFFLSKYGSDVDMKDSIKYFTRAASTYVNYLYHIAKEPIYYQQKFGKHLPNLISQAMYTALSECFPDSWIQFNHDFIEDIIRLVFIWLAGIRPTRGLWHSWNMQELKPTEQKLKEKIIEEQSRLGYTNLDGKVTDGLFENDFKQKQSTGVGAQSMSKNILFNTSGNSPLVQFYLQKRKVNLNVGTNYLLKHKEIVPAEFDENTETYQDVISESLQNLKQRVNDYKKLHNNYLVETQNFNRCQRLNNLHDKQIQQKLLENRRQVRNLSNLMVHEYLKDKDSISFGADKAVLDSISAIK